jgi:uncharacterized protein with GYD domain
MSTRIAFMNWTDQGVKGYRDTVARFDQARELAKGFGIEITQIYWTPGGPYDLVAVLEQTDERKVSSYGVMLESISSFGLMLESMGNLRIVTADAYGPDEMRAIVTATGD